MTGISKNAQSAQLVLILTKQVRHAKTAQLIVHLAVIQLATIHLLAKAVTQVMFLRGSNADLDVNILHSSIGAYTDARIAQMDCT